ncbi:MAG: hypothetical protein JXB13_18220 [Phycisphaerae bacterium]|nr:hypothetical protein [Phycisphaerae bacterium]
MWNVDAESMYDDLEQVEITVDETGVHGHDKVARWLIASIFHLSLEHGCGAARVYDSTDEYCLRVLGFRENAAQQLGYDIEEYVPAPDVVTEPAFAILCELFGLSPESPEGRLEHRCRGVERVAKARRDPHEIIIWLDPAYESRQIPTVREWYEWALRKQPWYYRMMRRMGLRR